jgi:hypothetical protein
MRLVSRKYRSPKARTANLAALSNRHLILPTEDGRSELMPWNHDPMVAQAAQELREGDRSILALESLRLRRP